MAESIDVKLMDVKSGLASDAFRSARLAVMKVGDYISQVEIISGNYQVDIADQIQHCRKTHTNRWNATAQRIGGRCNMKFALTTVSSTSGETGDVILTFVVKRTA